MLDRLGISVFRRLEGNFVVVAQSLVDDRVWAVRDRLGGRTLHYAKTSHGWFLAPWATQVLSAARLSAEPNGRSLAAYFAGQAPPPGSTAFTGVRELRPGEIMTIDASGRSSDWQAAPESPLDDYEDPARATSVFAGLLEESVAARLPASGPVAGMLSGGMDAGPMAAIAAARLHSQGRELIPISWSLPGHPEADEADWIRMLCRHLELQPRLFDPPERPLDSLSERLVSPDWPAFNPFRPLVEACYRQAAEAGCSVILNGNAGDDLYPELNLLYRGYRAHGESGAIWRDLRLIRAHGGAGALLSHPPVRDALKRWLGRTGRRAPAWMTSSAVNHWRSLPGEIESFNWHPVPAYAAQLLGSRMTFGRAHEQYFAARCGVERRDPYHDERLAGFMLHAPFSLSVREGRTKWIMREAMKGRLPERFRLKARTGLMASWFRAGLEANREAVRDLLFRQQPGWQEWVQADVIERALAGRRQGETLLIRCIGHALWQRHWQP